MLEATFTTLKKFGGVWGVRVEGPAEIGDVVLAHKRNGDATEVQVSRVVWSGTDEATCEPITVAMFVSIQRDRVVERAIVLDTPKPPPLPQARRQPPPLPPQARKLALVPPPAAAVVVAPVVAAPKPVPVAARKLDWSKLSKSKV